MLSGKKLKLQRGLDRDFCQCTTCVVKGRKLRNRDFYTLIKILLPLTTGPEGKEILVYFKR